MGAFLFALQIVFEIRWAGVAAAAGKLLAEDYAEWSKARAELKELKAKAPPQSEAVKNKAKDPKAAPAPEKKDEAPAPPKAVDTRAVKPLANGLPKLIEEKPAKAKAATNGDGARPAGPAPTSAYKDYVLPSLELLRLPPDEGSRSSKY